jgi:methylated-DNA-[protein]-cysteine S-methyltransferase
MVVLLAVTCLPYEIEGWGLGELWLEGRCVVCHELPRPAGTEREHPHPGWGNFPPPSRATLPDQLARGGDVFAPTLIARLRAFFAGEHVEFDDVELDLDGHSSFHRACAGVMRAVPRGEVVTYGELAALAGAPGAARAAGTFCARNKLSIFIPCHRVVAARGIGGYGSFGSEYKQRLLALEHVSL